MSSPTSPTNTSVTAVVDSNEDKSVASVEEIVTELKEGNVDAVKEAVSDVVSTTVNDVVSEAVAETVPDVVTDVIGTEVVDKVVDAVSEKVVDTVFDGLMEKLNVKVGSLEITPQTVMSVVRYAMEVVEASELKGEEQKNMVLRLLKEAITVAPISDEKEALCLQMIEDGVVANTIDIIVAATHGELEVNTVVENVVEIATNTGCCGLLSLLSKKSK